MREATECAKQWHALRDADLCGSVARAATEIVWKDAPTFALAVSKQGRRALLAAKADHEALDALCRTLITAGENADIDASFQLAAMTHCAPPGIDNGLRSRAAAKHEGFSGLPLVRRLALVEAEAELSGGLEK